MKRKSSSNRCNPRTASENIRSSYTSCRPHVTAAAPGIHQDGLRTMEQPVLVDLIWTGEVSTGIVPRDVVVLIEAPSPVPSEGTVLATSKGRVAWLETNPQFRQMYFSGLGPAHVHVITCHAAYDRINILMVTRCVLLLAINVRSR